MTDAQFPCYVPVPVEAARQIAAMYRKCIVIILAVDRAHDKVHTTTYGASPDVKALAAKLGDQATKAIVGCIDARQSHEDFCTRTQAQWAQEKDELLRIIDQTASDMQGLANTLLGRDVRTASKIAEAVAARCIDRLGKERGGTR